MSKEAERRRIGGALTVQLLGSVDDLVSPEDNVDLISDREFLYLDVPRTGHGDIIQMDPCTPKGKCRAEILARVLTLDAHELRKYAMVVADQPPATVRPEVADVVLVVHGIRDVGYWTQKVARRVIAKARETIPDKVFAMETTSYGYFPMAPFLLASQRREKVEWLMNQYAEAMVTYPSAEFSCVAHSNGTYLIAKALEQYPPCSFKRIVFAGSVVRRTFDWKDHVLAGRVGSVLNYVATSDWVVAWFPKLFELLRIQDLGSAGYDGFRGVLPASLWQVRFVPGGHGAALSEILYAPPVGKNPMGLCVPLLG